MNALNDYRTMGVSSVTKTTWRDKCKIKTNWQLWIIEHWCYIYGYVATFHRNSCHNLQIYHLTQKFVFDIDLIFINRLCVIWLITCGPIYSEIAFFYVICMQITCAKLTHISLRDSRNCRDPASSASICLSIKIYPSNIMIDMHFSPIIFKSNLTCPSLLSLCLVENT